MAGYLMPISSLSDDQQAGRRDFEAEMFYGGARVLRVLCGFFW
jgi:hypothetical protein